MPEHLQVVIVVAASLFRVKDLVSSMAHGGDSRQFFFFKLRFPSKIFELTVQMIGVG